MNSFAKISAVILLFSSFVGCGEKPDKRKKKATADALPTGTIERSVNVARSEITLQIRQYPEGNRGDTILVRLNIDRLRVCDLSKEDVIEALTPSSLVGHKEPLVPVPGVVFNSHHWRPEQYENIVLKANSDGEIVRLKDVANVELLSDGDAQVDDQNAATDNKGK